MFLLKSWATLLSVLLYVNSQPIGSKGIKNIEPDISDEVGFFNYNDRTESNESKKNIEGNLDNESREEALNVNYKPSRRIADFVSFSSLEPKAEMLPINYKNVVPPGVDHMELRSQRLSRLKNNGNNGSNDFLHRSNETIKKYHEPRTVENERSKIKPMDSVVKRKYTQTLVKDGTGDYVTGNVQKRKGIHERDREDEERNQDDARSQKVHNGLGYRNIYHQDEYKKDADFYDKRNPVGKYRKHVQYNDEERPIRVGIFAKSTTQRPSFEGNDER